MALTIRQENFCLEYAASGNAAESYKKAGYKPRNDNVAAANAARLLQLPRIQQRLQELAKELATPKIASIQEIQEFLTNVMRRMESEEEIVSAGDYGAEKMERKTPISAAIKAAETLAKMQGAFRTDINITGALPVIISGEDDISE